MERKISTGELYRSSKDMRKTGNYVSLAQENEAQDARVVSTESPNRSVESLPFCTQMSVLLLVMTSNV